MILYIFNYAKLTAKILNYWKRRNISDEKTDIKNCIIWKIFLFPDFQLQCNNAILLAPIQFIQRLPCFIYPVQPAVATAA